MQHAKDLRGGRTWPAWRIAIAVLAVAGVLADSAWAAKKPPANAKAAGEDAAPPRDTAGAQRAYAAGTRAFESGDMAEAERQLSVAISIGGLPNAQMARALYYRGSAYRKLGRPAQAISDLTTAVWLKGGLEGEDRKKAIEARQLAYQEAGLGDKAPPVGNAPADQSPSTAAPAPGTQPPAPKPGTIVAVVPPKGSSFWSNITSPSLPKLPSLPSIGSLTGSSTPAATPPAAGAAAAAAAQQPSGTVQPADPAQAFAAAPAVVTPAEAAPAPPAAAPAAPQPPQAVAPPPPPQEPSHTAAASWDTQTAAAGSSAPQSATLVSGYAPVAEGPASPPPQMAMTEQPAAPSGGSSWNPLAGTGQALANTGQAVGGFFSNMWSSVSGSSSQAAVEPAAAVTTGSTGAGAWGSETTVHTAQTSSMIQRGPDVPAAEDNLPWAATQSAPGAPVSTPAQKQFASAGSAGGKYKLQVAAVRSREEAERLTQSLQAYPGVRDGIVTAQIDEAVIGSMGTFYRVRLGPYADAKEPGQLCKTLRPQGFDCLVVTQ